MINRVTLLGHLGKDPDIKRLENGTPVGNFTIATTESYKADNGEWKDLTEWHNIVVWRGSAEYVEKTLKKGNKVYIEGKITHRKYTDQQGIERFTTEIVASTCRSLEKRESSGTEQTSTPSVQPTQDTPFSMPVNSDPLPQTGDEFKNNDNPSIIIKVSSVENGMVNYTVGEKVFKNTFDEWRTKILPKVTAITDLPF